MILLYHSWIHVTLELGVAVLLIQAYMTVDDIRAAHFLSPALQRWKVVAVTLETLVSVTPLF